MKVVLYLSLFVFLFGCASHKNIDKTDSSERIDQIKDKVTEQFGEAALFQISENKSYILCSKKPSEGNLNPNELNEFFVYDLNTNKEIYSDKISGAKLSWYSDYEILVVQQKGIISSPEDDGKNRYLIDMKTFKTKAYTKHEQIEN